MKRLYRSKTERMVSGVAGGIAQYIDVDPVITRLIFALSVFLGGFGIILYIILAIITPEKNDIDTDTPERKTTELHSTKVDVTEVCPPPAYQLLDSPDKRRWVGALLVVLFFSLVPGFIINGYLVYIFQGMFSIVGFSIIFLFSSVLFFLLFIIVLYLFYYITKQK